MRSLRSKILMLLGTSVFYLIFCLPTQGYAQTFKEGVDYSIVKSKSSTNETVEYFSYSCPGCFFMETRLAGLSKKLPSLKFRRVHVPYGGRNADVSQKAFVLLELLDAKHHHDAIFKRIHIDKNSFNNTVELLNYFKSLGYDESKVKETLASFSADMMLRKMNKETIDKGISSIPTIIVNGKYQINTSAVTSSSNLLELINYLNSLPAKRGALERAL